MATHLENLTAIRDNYSRILADLSDASEIDENGHPVSYSVDGQSVSLNEYRQSLLRDIKQISELIVDAGGPYEITTKAYT